ncbi:MAG TPA: hypothetical protein VLJ38_18555 [Polyangiaceae bacterium]|nr:hypothetical protein [Polyangiaceae bacterium]
MALFGAFCALAAAPSCGSERPSLGLRPHPAGAGGQGGSGAQGGGGVGAAVSRPPVAGMGGVSPVKHVETPGRSVFTVVHGIVDADLTAWCFGRVRDGVTKLVGSPVPPGGLAYGASLSFETLDGIDAARDGVVPFVITGDLSAIDGLDCAAAVERATAVMLADRGAGGRDGGASEGGATFEAMAGGGGAAGDAAGAAGAVPVPTPTAGMPPNTTNDSGGHGGEAGAPAALAPALRVGALPSLPAGALGSGFSLLEVADGCFGARAFDDPLASDACGADYTPNVGSLSAELVTLARETVPNMLALQALHASRATGALGFRTEPSSADDGVQMTLVDDLPEGALRPREPREDFPTSSWGVNTATWSLAATVNGVTYASELWPTVRRRAGLGPLEDGRGYTIIAIGPTPDIGKQGFWHEFAFTLVDNDPSVE